MKTSPVVSKNLFNFKLKGKVDEDILENEKKSMEDMMEAGGETDADAQDYASQMANMSLGEFSKTVKSGMAAFEGQLSRFEVYGKVWSVLKKIK